MKSTLFSIMLALAITPSLIAQNSQLESNNKVEQELINLTRMWDEAFVKRDVKTLENILSDDYTLSGTTKAQLLAVISSPEISYTSYQRKVVRVQLYEDTAVIFARNSVSGKYPGVDAFSSVFNSMDVWVKQHGRWRCVATMADQIKNANKEEEKMVRFGPDVKYSLVVYFKKGISEEQISNFLKENINQPRNDNRGHSFQKGICEYLRLLPLQNHEAFAIRICENATSTDREGIKSRIKASPLVYKVLEDVAPAEVKSIDQ